MRLKDVFSACVASVAVLSITTIAHAQGLMLTGYADLEFNLEKVDGGNSESYFDNHHFNLIAVGRLAGNVFAAAEIEYEHGGEEIALEYGYVSYTGIKNVRVAAGKFIVPFGRFNKDLHPTWINKMPDRPHGFKDVFPQTYSDVGVWVSGGAPVGLDGTRVVFDAFAVNGLMGDDGSGIRGMRGNDRDKFSAGGRDDNKAFGGRVGLELPQQGFDVGGSVYYGNYLDDPTTSLTLLMLGADAAFRSGGFEIRAEGVLAEQEATPGSITKKGGYAQIAYLFPQSFEPVARFSVRDMPGVDADGSRLSFGGNYYLASNAIVRAAYNINMEKSGFASDNDKIIAQFTMMF